MWLEISDQILINLENVQRIRKIPEKNSIAIAQFGEVTTNIDYASKEEMETAYTEIRDLQKTVRIMEKKD